MIDRQAFIDLYENFRLSTPRLLVRRLESKDERTQIEHEMNPDIMGFIRDPLPLAETVERIKRFREAWKAEEGEWLGFAVTERGENDLTGLVFLRIVSYIDETVEVGYRLHPDFHGKGYAAEATAGLLESLRERANVHKVLAYCVAENRASWRVMEKLGMEREGCLRQHSRLGGRWRDELVYGLIFES